MPNTNKFLNYAGAVDLVKKLLAKMNQLISGAKDELTPLIDAKLPTTTYETFIAGITGSTLKVYVESKTNSLVDLVDILWVQKGTADFSTLDATHTGLSASKPGDLDTFNYHVFVYSTGGSEDKTFKWVKDAGLEVVYRPIEDNDALWTAATTA